MKLTGLEVKFLRHLETNGCSAKTVEAYRSAFRLAWRVTAEFGVESHTAACDRTWA